jgi:hypothetical protein
MAIALLSYAIKLFTKHPGSQWTWHAAQVADDEQIKRWPGRRLALASGAREASHGAAMRMSTAPQ